MIEDIIIYQPRNGYAVRVFRPWEVRELIRAIPKNENKDKFEALLFSACRYSEIKWLYDHQTRFKGNRIHMKNTKSKVNDAYRYVMLNRQGERSVDNFLRAKTNLPSNVSWNENLKRWCVKAGIKPDHACCKSTRKTFESWLIITYPQRTFEILASLGHSENTALRHYLTFPFSKEDKNDMQYFVGGW